MNTKKLIAGTLALTLTAGAVALPLSEAGLNGKFGISASAEITEDEKWEYEVLDDGTVKLLKYNGNGGNVVAPSKIDGRNVVMIGEGCFDSSGNLLSVVIPEGVKIIEDSAFWGCNNLEWIQIPRSITSENGWISYDCDKAALRVYPGTIGYNFAKDTNRHYKLIGVTDISKAKVTGIKSSYEYLGKSVKPSFQVKYGSFVLRQGIDYNVSFNNNNKVGTATVTITGKGLFKGTIKRSFRINSVKVAKQTITKVKKLKNLIKVFYKKNSSATGYKIQLASNKKFVKARTYKLSKNYSAKTITNLTSKKLYYVRVQSYRIIGKTVYYGNWSKVVPVRAL